jgi:hypothetical protein
MLTGNIQNVIDETQMTPNKRTFLYKIRKVGNNTAPFTPVNQMALSPCDTP